MIVTGALLTTLLYAVDEYPERGEVRALGVTGRPADTGLPDWA